MEQSMNKFTSEITYNAEYDSYFIPFPDEMLPAISALGWTPDDEFVLIDNEDSTLTVKKKEKDNE
jgi:hypothetical protein